MECIECGKESKTECCSGKCRARKSRRTAHEPERTRTEDSARTERTEERTHQAHATFEEPASGIPDNKFTELSQEFDEAAVEEVKSVPVKKLTREQLTNKIRHYPGTEWVKSPEFKELMRRLNTMTTEQLQAEGYSVPAWKRQEVA